MRNKKIDSAGFHLLEILITLALVGILATIGLPVYSQHFDRERKLAAEQMLNKLAVAMEEYRIEYGSYKGATLRELKMDERVGEKHYQLKIESATDNEYLLSAEGKDKDDCGALQLNSAGERSCW
jgi:type IV pilus assembly protein PilE